MSNINREDATAMVSSSRLSVLPNTETSASLPLTAPLPCTPRKLYATASLLARFGQTTCHITTLNSTLRAPTEIAFTCISSEPVPNYTESGDLFACDNLFLLEGIEKFLEWRRLWKVQEEREKKELAAREKEWDLDAFEDILVKNTGKDIDLLTGEEGGEQDETQFTTPTITVEDEKWIGDNLIDLGEDVKDLIISDKGQGSLIDVGGDYQQRDKGTDEATPGRDFAGDEHADARAGIIWDGFEEDGYSSIQSPLLAMQAAKPYLVSPESAYRQPHIPVNHVWNVHPLHLQLRDGPVPHIPPPPSEPVFPVFLLTTFRFPNSIQDQTAWHCLGWFTISKISYYGPGELGLAEALSQVIPDEEPYFDLYLKYMAKTWAGIKLTAVHDMNLDPMEGVQGFLWTPEVDSKAQDTQRLEEARQVRAKSIDVLKTATKKKSLLARVQEDRLEVSGEMHDDSTKRSVKLSETTAYEHVMHGSRRATVRGSENMSSKTAFKTRW